MSQERFAKEYARVIESVVPRTFLDQAQQTVKNRKPQGLHPEFQPEAMAKVVVVEDNDEWLEMHLRRARKHGHTTFAATSAAEGEKLLKDHQDTKLVVTDGLDGGWERVYNAAQRLADKPEVLIVSGDYYEQRRAEKKGIPFLQKGRNWDEVLDEKLKNLDAEVAARQQIQSKE